MESFTKELKQLSSALPFKNTFHKKRILAMPKPFL